MCTLNRYSQTVTQVPAQKPILAYKAVMRFNGDAWKPLFAPYYPPGGWAFREEYQAHTKPLARRSTGPVSRTGFFAYRTAKVALKYHPGDAVVPVYLWGTVVVHTAGKGGAAGYRAEYMRILA